MIKFLGVSKTFKNGCVALRDIDLEVKKGEFVFLIGPSGAGKTTLFKVLYGEETPDNGEVRFEEESVHELSRTELALSRRRIGVVFQDFRLLASSSVFENVALTLEVLAVPEAEVEERVQKTLRLVGLSEKEKDFPWQLSGGERQRVALARALVGNPDLVLADEPTAEVDPATTWNIMEILEKINKKGTTVIVATHDSEIVNSLKKRVLKIEAGRLVADEKRGTYV